MAVCPTVSGRKYALKAKGEVDVSLPRNSIPRDNLSSSSLPRPNVVLLPMLSSRRSQLCLTGANHLRVLRIIVDISHQAGKR
jgi:hypothetical protein